MLPFPLTWQIGLHNLYIHNMQVYYLYYTQYIRCLPTFRDIRQVEIHIFLEK